ncbi:Na+/H+ antiporter subunit E [Brachybacterium sp. UNK5269]|uniref:Na+/H+ antiporter subunit E n=1 Tax=Brachybacterium sp. UNK5269 TaxID=3408576 RepID=UPI003BB0007A
MRTLQRLKDLRRSWLWIVVSVALWCLLWGGIDLKNVLGGLLAAVLVFVLFPMPPTGHELTLRPLRFAHFVARFLWDVAVSAVQLSWFAIRPQPVPPSSVVAVKMASRSDFFLTFTGVLCTLIPGSVVVEAQRATGMLFMHTFAAGTPEEVEQARRRVLGQEERLLWAVGRREVLEEAGLR